MTDAGRALGSPGRELEARSWSMSADNRLTRGAAKFLWSFLREEGVKMERPPQCRGRSENGVIPTVSVGRWSLDITLGSVITCILQGGMSHGLVVTCGIGHPVYAAAEPWVCKIARL